MKTAGNINEVFTVNVSAPSNGTSCRSFLYLNHSSAIVVADDESELVEQQEQVRKVGADLVPFIPGKRRKGTGC